MTKGLPGDVCAAACSASKLVTNVVRVMLGVGPRRLISNADRESQTRCGMGTNTRTHGITDEEIAYSCTDANVRLGGE